MRMPSIGALTVVLLACGSSTTTSRPGAAAAPIVVEAGFVDIAPRDVVVKGQPVALAATAHLFYNLRPADAGPEDAPILFLSNGFAAEVVRAFGTGPTTVAEDGTVVSNAATFTRFANVVYLEPRQAGYSYDVVAGRAPEPGDCAPTVFNEYVDAADFLMGALTFLDKHPQLRGPIYWLGESYAGVRLTWLLAYLRGRWDLASYSDPTLAAKINGTQRSTSLRAGEILLEAWLAGGAHTQAIAAECADPIEVSGVSASVGSPCPTGTDACTCTSSSDRSLYNYTFTTGYETARETAASSAHILPDRAAALLGVPLTSIPLLAVSARATGFKCSAPDDTVPAEDPLIATLGALPDGQAWYVPYSPLLPGKETSPTTLDWRTTNAEGVAFLDNLREVPTFLTSGARDLVVPTLALAPALRSIVGDALVSTTPASDIVVAYPDGTTKRIDVFAYPNAGHMVSMVSPSALSADVSGWITALAP